MISFAFALDPRSKCQSTTTMSACDAIFCSALDHILALSRIIYSAKNTAVTKCFRQCVRGEFVADRRLRRQPQLA